MTTYPSAAFSRKLAQLEGPHFRTWRRKFFCPNPSCELRRREVGKRGRRLLRRQEIREHIDQAHGYHVSGYSVERVELSRELLPLRDLPDGTLHFGPSRSGWRQPPTPGQPVPSPLRQAIPVLSSEGDFYRVGRNARSRVRGGTGPHWNLALSEERAAQSFAVTCPDCRERCWVDGSLPEAEHRA